MSTQSFRISDAGHKGCVIEGIAGLWMGIRREDFMIHAAPYNSRTPWTHPKR